MRLRMATTCKVEREEMGDMEESEDEQEREEDALTLARWNKSRSWVGGAVETKSADEHVLPRDAEAGGVVDLSEDILFSKLCVLLKSIGQVNGTKKKLKVLSTFTEELRQRKSSLFSLMRLIVPYLEKTSRERGNYFMRHKTLASQYTEVGRFGDEDTRRIVEFQRPKSNPDPQDDWWQDGRICGSLPKTIRYVLTKRRTSGSRRLTLGEVNSFLDRLANRYKSGDKLGNLWRDMIEQLSPVEHEWLARIILITEMNMGLSDTTILRHGLHRDAEKWKWFGVGLRSICEYTAGSPVPSDAACVTIFRPFDPMLASKYSTNQLARVVRAMDGPFLWEVKRDGERVLCHKKGKVINWWTRRQTLYNTVYEVLDQDILQLPVTDDVHVEALRGQLDFILDGEMCVWDWREKRMAPFGNNITVSGLEKGSYDSRSVNEKEKRQAYMKEGLRLYYVVFDCVWLQGSGSVPLLRQAAARLDGNNGNRFGAMVDNVVPKDAVEVGPLTELPLLLRKEVLQLVVGKGKHKRVEAMRYHLVDTKDPEQRRMATLTAYERVVEDKEEGMVVKNAMSLYQVGKRPPRSWCKLKPEYSDHCKDMDLLILGGKYATGDRQSCGHIVSYLVGVEGVDPCGERIYLTVGEVGLGLNQQEQARLWALMPDEKFKPFDKDKQPGWLGRYQDGSNLWTPTGSDVPDVIVVDPRDSCVLVVACFGFQSGVSYSAKKQLRFPQIKRISEKPPNQALKWFELKKILCSRFESVKAEALREIQKEREREEAVKRRIKMSLNNKVVIGRRFMSIDREWARAQVGKSDVFKGLVFCVLGKNQGVHDKHTGKVNVVKPGQVQMLIMAGGGKCMAHPSDPSVQIVVGAPCVMVENMLRNRNNSVDIVTAQWVYDCFEWQYLEPPILKPMHHLHLRQGSPLLKRRRCFDDYGDGYCVETDKDALSALLRGMSGAAPLTTMELSEELDEDEKRVLFGDRVFAGDGCDPLKAHFYTEGVESYAAKVLWRLGGGVVVEDLCDDGKESPLIFVNLDQCDLSPEGMLCRKLEDLRSRHMYIWSTPRLVRTDYVEAVSREGRYRDPTDAEEVCL